jgi:5-methyltetrahydropteroyltriglutamate--homocysteine methyltransferase
MKKHVKTTVIGSYPTNINNEDIMNNYFNQTEPSWNTYIESAVKDQIKAGIDIIADGQTRDPFVNIFYRKLRGCRIRDRPEIIDKVEYESPIILNDQKYVKQLLPKDKQLIGLLAGPYTLSQSCVDLFYNDEKQLAFDFAQALKQEAKNLQKYVDMISIDEPFFSVSMPDYAKELIEIVTKNVSCPIRLHSCGDVSKIVKNLLELPVDIFSHEFKATPKLFDAFEPYSFPQSICLGSIRSDKTRIEPIDEIVSHIRKGIDIFGEKISQIAPDCGLRLLPRDIAFNKLENLVKAGEIVYGG